jgi:phage terminase large subunit-like protein
VSLPDAEGRPIFESTPPALTSRGRDAVDLAALAGLYLDPWQSYALDSSLGEQDDKWAAFEVAVIVPRQNGKGALLEARELAGLFLFGEKLIIHTAHEFKTAQEAFRRIRFLIESTPALDKRVKKIWASHGDEGIELKTGQRLRFLARSGGSGRGFSGDCVILDEAYALTGDHMAAILPTLSARPNPQVWYTSSAGLAASDLLRSIRDRGRPGGEPSLCYLEWCARTREDGTVNAENRVGWVEANPAMGIRISEEFVEKERRALPEREFTRERLGLWEESEEAQPISPAEWQAACDPPVRDRR